MLVLVISFFIGCTGAHSQEPVAPTDDFGLSEDVRTLLVTEMREIAGASQAVAMSLVTGDWSSIERISEEIRDSYVMEQNLTKLQRQELQDKLPDHFKQLDFEFHARAERLGSAAAAKNAEIVAFHYYRMLETCVACHAAYATSRFPGLSSEAAENHKH
jgi:hypothetical protein